VTYEARLTRHGAVIVDEQRFDRLTRILTTSAPRRRIVGGLGSVVLAVLLGISAESVAGKKRRKKKRKDKPKEICRELREACSFDPEERCCGALVCDDNTCIGDPVCLLPAGGSCRDRCDCRFGLECSDRAGNTCRQCVLLQNPCETHGDCCLLSAACGSTIFATGVCCQQLGGACGLDSDCCANTGKCGLDGCGGVELVCCRGLGSLCGSSCECCDPLRCMSGTCQ
jgi:hypothetical protein